MILRLIIIYIISLPPIDQNSEYNQAIDQCSLETHCPNGISDCDFPQSCWHGLTECDIRDFTPFELGGFLNRPTQQELVEGMGLTYPSDDVSVFVCIPRMTL